MEQPKMDLPELSSNHIYNNKDTILTDSSKISPESVTSESIDTGFASDGTHQDSPSPQSDKRIIGGTFDSEERKTIMSPENTKTNGYGDSDSQDENKTDAPNSIDGMEEQTLSSSGDNETEISPAAENKETDSSEPKEPETETTDLEKDQDAQDDKDDGYIDILGNGLLKKKVLVPGKGIDSRPTNEDVVTVKIRGQLDDGTQVEDDEVTFTLNDGDVIVAFELAVALMELGEKCELFTSSRYAYGELGREPDIPKDANITYILELVNVKPPVDVSALSCDERLRFGEDKRERGNYLFKRADYSGAINSYSKAVKILDDTDLNAGLDEANRNLLADCWTKCYNNMAACQLKIEALDAAIRSCEKVLSHQSDNVKALFRIGKAYRAKGEVDHAISYLKKAIKLDPESKIMHQEMLALTRRKSKETESERKLYQRMFGIKSESPQSNSDDKKNSSSVMKWTLLLGALTAATVSVGLTWYRNS